jgi:hypothetical protein
MFDRVSESRLRGAWAQLAGLAGAHEQMGDASARQAGDLACSCRFPGTT